MGTENTQTNEPSYKCIFLLAGVSIALVTIVAVVALFVQWQSKDLQIATIVGPAIAVIGTIITSVLGHAQGSIGREAAIKRADEANRRATAAETERDILKGQNAANNQTQK